MKVRFLGPGDVAQGVPRVYDASTLPELGLDVDQRTYLKRDAFGVGVIGENISGVSIARLIPGLGGVVSHVTSVDVDNVSHVTLHPEVGDLLEPGDPGFPFVIGNTDHSPPVVGAGAAGITFYMSARAQPSSGAGVENDGVRFDSTGQTLVTVRLDGSRLYPTVVPTEGALTVPADRDIAFTGRLANAAAYGWTWDFGDGSTTGSQGPSSTHRFSEPGTYDVRATVEGKGGDRSSGLSAPIQVEVTPAQDTTTSAPPTDPTTPPPGESHGNGPSPDPTVGPRDGDGPRVGGVPTQRTGTGQAGSTFDPRSVQPSVANSASGGAQADGNVVGYLLSDGDAAALAAQAAAKPLDDSAPAARDGAIGHDVAAWIIGALVVVALLAVGAGSERRRPARAGRRRPRERA